MNFSLKKKIAAAATVLVMVGGAGAAFAYFTTNGSGTGNATVGTSSPWAVTFAPNTGGPLYPGTGTVTVHYTIRNPGSGQQNLNGTTAALTASGLNVVDSVSSQPVDGCLVSWFTVTNITVSGNLAPTAALTSSVTVTMQDSGTTQDACKNASPQVTVNAS